ncbi:GNAT family N-acetyltransferase [Catenuloplanes sp. NPDC051500]|uniref:GNAT family N-acetyltransferase n=1 Tax=Catenuloplanes sp. NPDC051500 TaxID=3363959 RepID=UPI0037A64923
MDRFAAGWAERAEAEFMYRYASGAPDADRETLGMSAHRVAGGVVVSARHDPTRYWNKALGFGYAEPVTGDLVARILEVYRGERNTDATLQIAPEALPPDWDEIVRKYGLTPGARVAKWAAPVDNIEAGDVSALRVAPVEPEHAVRWAEAVLDGLGKPHAGFVGMLVAAAASPAAHAFAAWSGDTVVGGGLLHVHGDVGSLNHGAVLAPYRRQGGQAALIAARVAVARELGCRWIVTETFQPDEGESNSSLNNMRRAGLTKLYVRRNFLWRGDDVGDGL